MKKEATFYENSTSKLRCMLCPHQCCIVDGHVGKCGVRYSENGKLYTRNYGEITSMAMDPIEKNPLAFFHPGSRILSVGSFGCNFVCGFCQNFRISQQRVHSDFVEVKDLVQIILEKQENIGIAFTYNEPIIWYEYVLDVAKTLKITSPDKSVVLVTNGFIAREPLMALLPYVDAMNIDLKSMEEDFYGRVCGGRVAPVLKTIETTATACHIEITTLLVPGENDTLDEVRNIASFLGQIRRDIPLHLSRYFPQYKMHNPPTNLDFMKKAQEIALKYLDNVRLGNI